MTDRKLFGTNTLIDDFLQRLTKIETVGGGWSTKYLDNETGRYWLKYTVDDRGFFQNLMLISPPPTTDELIELAFTSEYPDEVSAAARRLCIEEQTDKKEFRQKLTDRLNEVNLSRLEQRGKERIKIIIQASEITDGVNKRDIVGKHFTEIQKDADFFKTVSDNARRILRSL